MEHGAAPWLCSWLVLGWFDRQKFFREASRVTFQQYRNPIRIGRSQNQSGMVMSLDSQGDFRIVVGGRVRIVLPRQGKNHARIFFADWRQFVAAVAAGDFDAGPLSPEIDSGRGFDHLVDVGAADARGALQKIKMPVGVGVDKFRMRDAAHQAQRGDQVAIDGAQGCSRPHFPAATVNVVKIPPPCATFIGGLPYLLTLAKTTSFSDTTEST